MTFLQVVAGHAHVEMMDVMVGDVEVEPMQPVRKVDQGRTLKCRHSGVVLLFFHPVIRISAPQKHALAFPCWCIPISDTLAATEPYKNVYRHNI